MPYTMNDVDSAITYILGNDVFKALIASNSAGRIVAHKMAIERAFMNKIDNGFTDILRDSMADLNKGQYRPKDGIFND